MAFAAGITEDPTIHSAALMPRARVSLAPGTSSVVKPPFEECNKPCVLPAAVKYPTISPARLIPAGLVTAAPETSIRVNENAPAARLGMAGAASPQTRSRTPRGRAAGHTGRPPPLSPWDGLRHPRCESDDHAPRAIPPAGLSKMRIASATSAPGVLRNLAKSPRTSACNVRMFTDASNKTYGLCQYDSVARSGGQH